MRWLSLWGPVLGLMLLLFAASAQRGGLGSAIGWDKLAHALAYAGLGLVTIRACHGGTSDLRLGPTLLALALTVSYGAFDEWHQTYVPGRVSSLGDLAADGVGAVAAIPIAMLLARFKARGRAEGVER